MIGRTKLLSSKLWVLAPVLGIGIFIVLYVIAALLYPGGSSVDRDAEGFSWIHNYWCDLLSKWAKNGQPNAAWPVALTAMITLCLSLSLFWFFVPGLLNTGKHHYGIVQLSGIASMMLAIFIFTNYHDFIINAAVFFGVVALSGTYVALYRSKAYKTLAFGVFCLILVLLNGYIYYTKYLIFILPLLQKVTFFLYLLWILSINLKLFSR